MYWRRGSGIPRRTSRPVSSAISRTAATGQSSPGSSLPLAQDQSSYLGRCTSATSRCPRRRRHGTVPAAGTTRDGVAVIGSGSRSASTDVAPCGGAWRGVSIMAVWRSVERLALGVEVVAGPSTVLAQVPAATSSRAIPSSSSEVSSATCRGSVTRSSASTRRSRLRCIMSALPMETRPARRRRRTRTPGSARGTGPGSSGPDVARDSPSTPGRSAQMPRTQTSTWTPACEAR